MTREARRPREGDAASLGEDRLLPFPASWRTRPVLGGPRGDRGRVSSDDPDVPRRDGRDTRCGDATRGRLERILGAPRGPVRFRRRRGVGPGPGPSAGGIRTRALSASPTARLPRPPDESESLRRPLETRDDELAP